MRNKFILTALLLCVTAFTALAQKGVIRGSVKGSDGDILSGATLVAQSGKYAIADADGAWSLQAKEGETVTVSFFGYDEKVFTVGKQAVYDIVLQQSAATMLDETVIIGYGKTTKREVTGSVASLKADDLDKGSFTTAAQMLQGKVAGLTVTNPNGGDPNASYEILLRGTNTLKAGQGPLIIIEGVADADIRNINYQEVESIDEERPHSYYSLEGSCTQDSALAVFTAKTELYSVGAAHGLYTVRYLTVDKETGNVIHLPDLVTDTNLLCEAIAHAIRWVCGHREDALAMARRGRELVRTMFDAETNTGRLYELYAAHAAGAAGTAPGSGSGKG